MAIPGLKAKPKPIRITREILNSRKKNEYPATDPTCRDSDSAAIYRLPLKLSREFFHFDHVQLQENRSPIVKEFLLLIRILAFNLVS